MRGGATRGGGARARGACALALGALLAAGPAAAQAPARCADHIPQARPQNTARDIVGADLDDIQARGHIDIALYEDFAPWSYREGGRIVGVDADIARLIAEELGVEARLRLVAADESLEADLRNWIWRGPVTGGRVANLMMHVPYDSEFGCRIEQVVFTGLYHEERMGIAYDPALYPGEAPEPGHFRTRKVGVENHAMADFYLSSTSGGILRESVVRYPSTAAAMAALAAGEIGAVMGPLGELEGAIARAPETGTAVHAPQMAGFSRGQWTVGVAVHFAYRPLSYTVEDIVGAALADGRIGAIFAEHGLSLSAPEW